MRHRTHAALALAVAAALFLAPNLARAQDSGTGIDFQFGSKLDPEGNGQPACDERGASWLRGERHRTPTGALYACPPARPMTGEEWLHSGTISFGWLATGGDTDNMHWLRYNGWDESFILGFFQFEFLRPADGSYVDVRGSWLDEDNHFVKANVGRAGKYRVEAFGKSQPNVVAGRAKSIWDNLDSPRLTLVAPLVPAGSTPAQVAAASAAAPERVLQVTRDKQGLGVNYTFDKRWTGYFNATSEQREGNRPFGGPFFFNFPFPDNGGVYETPRPIDDSTVNVNGGLRFVGNVWRMDLNYTGSFYRSKYTGWSYENPYALYPVVPGAVSASFQTGNFASEPDNDYHNIRAAFTRKLAMNGELTLAVAGGTMRQNDDLLAPIDCQGTFGIDLTPTGSPVNPFLYDCDDWNTTDALSQKTADMRIDTSRADANLVLQPTSAMTLRASAKFSREDYRNVYLAYNPLTGQYGYVAENGAQGSVVPGEMGIYDPIATPSIVTRIRSLPLDKEIHEASLGADWRIDARNTLGATYTYTGLERTNREREQVDDHLVKLTWANRAFDWLTFRANYSYLRQSGDTYNFDPYEFSFSSSLPGFIEDEAAAMPHTVEALRKYDVGSRDQHKFTFISTLIPRHDMSLSATLRGDWNDYDAELGRQNYDTLGATLTWDWQPSPQSNVSSYVAWDRSKLGIANVNEAATSPADPLLGGAVYTNEGRWWVDDSQRNRNAGLTFDYDFGRVRIDAGYNWMYSRGMTDYSFASALALAYPDLAALAGSAFPAMTYRINALDVGASFAFGERTSVRVFDRYERGSISDWHYLGLEDGLVLDHRIYLDQGPVDYSSNLVGILLEIRL